MASKGHGGLGKGLGALMGNTKLTPARDRVQEISVEEIRPNRYQPRQDFDEENLSQSDKELPCHFCTQEFFYFFQKEDNLA